MVAGSASPAIRRDPDERCGLTAGRSLSRPTTACCDRSSDTPESDGVTSRLSTASKTTALAHSGKVGGGVDRYREPRSDVRVAPASSTFIPSNAGGQLSIEPVLLTGFEEHVGCLLTLRRPQRASTASNALPRCPPRSEHAARRIHN